MIQIEKCSYLIHNSLIILSESSQGLGFAQHFMFEVEYISKSFRHDESGKRLVATAGGVLVSQSYSFHTCHTYLYFWTCLFT
jgi:hypothetical protein